MVSARIGGAAIALALLAGTARASESVRYEGTAFDLESSQPLYRESHFVSRAANGDGQRVVLYRCLDGRAFARKRVRYQGRDTAPAFTMYDRRQGYREGLRRDDNALVAYARRSREQAPKEAVIARDAELIADAGFDDFVRARWAELEAGEAVHFQFLVPSKLDVFHFKLKLAEKVRVDAREAAVVRVSLGNWWGFLLPHIDAVYADQGRQLLSFSGLSNVRDLDSRNYNARIEFPLDRRADLGPGELDAALREPLTPRCEG